MNCKKEEIVAEAVERMREALDRLVSALNLESDPARETMLHTQFMVAFGRFTKLHDALVIYLGGEEP